MRPFECCDWTEIEGAKYLYLNDDNPMEAYQSSGISFVAQPLAERVTNEENNVVTVPLMMTDEWDLLEECPQIVEELRQTDKKYEYMFIGQCNYKSREIFRNLPLHNYYMEDNPKGIFHLSPEEKRDELIKYLRKTAEAKFIFAPRGMGSSSFRLYQSFMVGSVPIVTGMLDYPFSEEVDWDGMCLRGSLSELVGLIQSSKTIDYQDYRDKGMKFWDEYCKHDKLYDKIKKYAR